MCKKKLKWKIGQKVADKMYDAKKIPRKINQLFPLISVDRSICLNIVDRMPFELCRWHNTHTEKITLLGKSKWTRERKYEMPYLEHPCLFCTVEDLFWPFNCLINPFPLIGWKSEDLHDINEWHAHLASSHSNCVYSVLLHFVCVDFYLLYLCCCVSHFDVYYVLVRKQHIPRRCTAFACCCLTEFFFPMCHSSIRV